MSAQPSKNTKAIKANVAFAANDEYVDVVLTDASTWEENETDDSDDLAAFIHDHVCFIVVS